MAMIETWINQDLQNTVKIRYIEGNVFSQDNNGNLIGVSVSNNGTPASLEGTVSANVIRSDGVTVAVEGGFSHNRAFVILPQAAYAVPGVISVIIKITNESDVTTLAAIIANVYESTTDTVVDPGTIIPSVETLLAAIEEAVASIPADYSTLWATLAPEFSSSADYKKGEYTTYDGGLYRFIVDHSGSWSSSDVESVNVGGEIYKVYGTIDEVKESVGFEKVLLTRNVLDGRDAIGKTPQEIDYQSFYCGLGYSLFLNGFNNVTLHAIDVNDNYVTGCAYAPVYSDGTVGSYDYEVNVMYNKNNFTNYSDIVGISFRAYSAATTTVIKEFGIYYNAEDYEEYEEYSHSWTDDRTNYNGCNTLTPVTFEASADVIGIDGIHAVYQYYEHTTVSCKPGETYELTGTGFGSLNYPLVIFLSLTNVVVGYFGQQIGYATIKVMAPEGAVYMLINNENRLGNIHINKCTTVQPYERIIEPIDYDNFWNGKKIVWFGTSIPAGVVNAGESGGNGSYPVRLGERLGATVYNESIGSSRVVAGSHGSAVTEDDPMGFGGQGAIGVFLSMSLSSSEKQAIYDDWDEKWSSIIPGGEDIDWNNMQRYYNSSWDIMLTKYLTGGSVGPVDCYVFDHGFNDRGQTILDVPDNPDDRRYFYGAMSFLFKKILQDNPKARIIICGHYSDTQTFMGGTDLVRCVCEAQTILSEKWSFPIIKTWEHMGFSFVDFTYNGQTTTVLKQWMPDGVHPASDTTGKALEHYANVLYPIFRDLR